MTVVCYESCNDDKSDNNEDKIRSLLRNDIGKSQIRSLARSHDPRFCDHSVISTFWFGYQFKDGNWQKSVT